MSEERKVMCRCGEEMHFGCAERDCLCGEAPWGGMYTCRCGWLSPYREGDTPEDCERNAYLAATATPPNRPLTREQDDITRIRLLQYESLRKNFYALIESVLGKDYYNLGMDVYNCDAMACEDIANKAGAKWIAPIADLSAARAGQKGANNV